MIESRFVKMLPGLLTPFVRSDAVGAILAEVFVHPDVELSLAELARRTEVAQAVVHKEVSRLVVAGVLLDRRDGNNRLVRVNRDHLLFVPMQQIIAATYGPVPVLRELLGGVDGVRQAFIYGSWAARRSGEAGLFPHDVDVLVVGALSVDDLLDVQAVARDRLGTDVNIHRVTQQVWADRAADAFLLQVSSRPMIELIGGQS